MSEDEYKTWFLEMEAISNRITDLYEAIHNTVEASASKRRVLSELVNSHQHMTNARKKLFTLHSGKVLA